MKPKEIREMSLKDLRERVDAEKQNLVQIKLNHSISPLEDTSKIKKARRDVARMITILAQREQEEAVRKASETEEVKQN
ncbi:MAG: 50S ribosomal protein L29 [Bacteroidales bacterium]|jgi:large subunit ribosomal protein L29|nr:50S ribosomal protein L29 [Bacteroidales bacterium]MCI2121973.1 50S ribosomal protein L29 [Bacteroidales bacterium]MCI2146116.1 50S ribosomal protein L29 [Bacteroidales bacterium]